MSDASKTSRRLPDKRQDEYMKGGKGRTDKVGGSGIYPASAPNAPPDAVIRGQGELGHTASHHMPPHEQGGDRGDDRSGDLDR